MAKRKYNNNGIIMIFDSNCNYGSCIEKQLTIFLEMDHNEWLKTYAGTLEQQNFTSPYIGITTLCAVVASWIKLLDLTNDSIKTILCSIGRLKKTPYSFYYKI
jgi:hypothetical protein